MNRRIFFKALAAMVAAPLVKTSAAVTSSGPSFPYKWTDTTLTWPHFYSTTTLPPEAYCQQQLEMAMNLAKSRLGVRRAIEITTMACQSAYSELWGTTPIDSIGLSDQYFDYEWRHVGWGLWTVHAKVRGC